MGTLTAGTAARLAHEELGRASSAWDDTASVLLDRPGACDGDRVRGTRRLLTDKGGSPVAMGSVQG